MAANPQGQPSLVPVATMTKQYAIIVPMDASEVATEHLKTYLIPLKTTLKEINEYIQRIERELRDRK